MKSGEESKGTLHAYILQHFNRLEAACEELWVFVLIHFVGYDDLIILTLGSIKTDSSFIHKNILPMNTFIHTV